MRTTGRAHRNSKASLERGGFFQTSSNACARPTRGLEWVRSSTSKTAKHKRLGVADVGNVRAAWPMLSYAGKALLVPHPAKIKCGPSDRSAATLRPPRDAHMQAKALR